MTTTDNLIADTTTKIFQDLADRQTVNLATDERWQQDLWAALEEMGLTRTWVPDTLGGAGASTLDGFEVLRVAGAFAVAVPLAETLIAGWGLAHAGLETPEGRLSVALGAGANGGSISVDDDGALSGSARAVPFAREAEHLVVQCVEGKIALVPTKACRIQPGQSLAHEARDTVDFTGARALQVGLCAEGVADLLTIGAAVRSMQMAGALQTLLDISVQYSTERVAFERPIGKFQAVQHNLARLAGEVAAANAVANSAAYTLDATPSAADSIFVEVASAKIRVGEAAHEGSMIAHQVHGAIGFTQEHILHRYTHRLWSWRNDFGDESFWAAKLGAKFAAEGADALWPTLTAL